MKIVVAFRFRSANSKGSSLDSLETRPGDVVAGFVVLAWIRFTRFALRMVYISAISSLLRRLSFSFQAFGSKIRSLKSCVSLSTFSSYFRSILNPIKSVPTRAYLATCFMTLAFVLSSRFSSTAESGYDLKGDCMILSRLALNAIILVLC